MMKQVKPEKWYRPLFSILWMILIDIIALIAAVIIDTRSATQATGTGHGGPFAITLVIMVFGFISIIVVVFALMHSIANLIHLRPKKPSAQGFSTPSKPVSYLWMIPAQLVVDAAIVIIAWNLDVASYTPAPNGSFMIPVTTFFAVIIMGVISLLVIAVSISLTNHSKKRAIQ